MIIQNGTIEFKLKVPGGISTATGYPVPSTFSWGDAIPCQYVHKAGDLLATADGEHYVQRNFSVFVEQLEALPAEQLRLKGIAGDTIGEFSIIAVEQLDAVRQTKISI